MALPGAKHRREFQLGAPVNRILSVDARHALRMGPPDDPLGPNGAKATCWNMKTSTGEGVRER